MKTLNKKQGFTLVELIVSIVILAILGTIGYISMSSYSEISRDSTRISDLGRIKTGLELFMVDSGKYPLPTNGVDITYLSGTVWTQGTYGEQTNLNVDKLSKLPLDPLTESKYTYSLTSRGNEYELSGIVEGDLAYSPHPNPLQLGEGIAALLNQTNAGEGQVKAIVTGTYNGKVTKMNDGTTCSLLAVPTIIVSDTTEFTDLEELSANKKFVYNGYNNLPSSYKGSKFNNNGGFDFEPNELLLYSDFLGCSVLENNESERITVLKKLQESYSGTLLETEGDYKELMDINIDLFAPNNTSKLISRSIMINNLGLRLSEGSFTYLNCESGDVNGYTYENIAHGLGKSVTKTGTITYGTQNYGAQAICDNGVVTIKNENINTICNSGYVEQAGQCVADICNGTIPTNGISTATSQSVSTTWIHNSTTPGQCTFKCDTNYVYNNGTNTCNSGTQNTNCTSLPTNAQWNTTNNITQTWNGTNWLPLEIGSYDTTASTTECKFKCDTNYTWNGTSCMLNTYTVSGGFGANANGSIINVCGTNVTADASGNFTSTRNYGSTCNTITATKTGYTCNITTNGPASLTSNTTNIAGSCTLNFVATGGTITYTDSNGLNPRSGPAYVGGYVVHTFTTSGTFIVIAGSKNVQYLVVAGGGGGGYAGNGGGGGGGGAGGLLAGTILMSSSANVTVGGWAGGGGNGESSAFGGITAIGGGAGGVGDNASGLSGGSGGGGNPVGGSYGAGTAGQGNRGGYVGGLNQGDNGAAGGGGAGGIGNDNIRSNIGTDGGAGLASSISGINTIYAAGGAGGGGSYRATGQVGITGVANTGNGGGGAGYEGTPGTGASGIVIARYLY